MRSPSAFFAMPSCSRPLCRDCHALDLRYLVLLSFAAAVSSGAPRSPKASPPCPHSLAPLTSIEPHAVDVILSDSPSSPFRSSHLLLLGEDPTRRGVRI